MGSTLSRAGLLYLLLTCVFSAGAEIPSVAKADVNPTPAVGITAIDIEFPCGLTDAGAVLGNNGGLP